MRSPLPLLLLLCAICTVLPASADGGGSALTRQYQSLLTRMPPGEAQIGVTLYPGTVLRVNQSAQLMAANFPDENKSGRSPTVYALETFVPSRNYAEIVAYYSRYARPGTTPKETGHNTHSLRTVIELAVPETVKQRIVVAPSFTGLGCTTSWNEDYSARCVTVYIVSRGPARRP